MSSITELVGNRIKFFRNKRDLSQEQLALKAGINISFLGQIERHKKKPTIDTLEKIIDALDITFQDFFNFEFQNENKENDSTVINRLSYYLGSRSIDEQEKIYSIIKDILQLKNMKQWSFSLKSNHLLQN